MNYDPFKVIPAVLVAVLKNNQVLLAKRNNTSYMDGWYGLPGGHLEDDETLQQGAARELKEEVGLVVKPEDLELFHIYQNRNTPGRQYIGFMFRARKWSGKPENMESKVQAVEFFELENLPQKLIPYHIETLRKVNVPAIETTFIQLGSFNPSGK